MTALAPSRTRKPARSPSPGCVRPPRRPRPLHSTAEVPLRLYRHMFDEMAGRLSGGAAARGCVGLSFGFRLTDRDDLTVRYEVCAEGAVAVGYGEAPATFTFTGVSDDFDAVLARGLNPLPLILCRRIGFSGSLLRLRHLLVMLPALRKTYLLCRAALRLRYAAEFDFRF